MSVQGHDIEFYEDLELGDAPRIFDVGANVGDTVRLFKRLWPGSRIECFEPNPAAFRRLEESTFDMDDVQTYFAGLSDEPGTGKLHFAGGPDESASLHDRDLSYAGIELHPHTVTVELRTLSEYLGGGPVDLLKLDAEGHELKILQGAGDFLRPNWINIIAFEFNSCNLDSRTFLKDFWDLLVLERRYRLFQTFGHRWEQVEVYGPELEDFHAHREFMAIDPELVRR